MLRQIPVIIFLFISTSLVSGTEAASTETPTVIPSKAPVTCPKGLVYKLCGCDQTCDEMDTECECTEGCFCPDKHYWMNGTCVSEFNCYASQACGRNERFRSLGFDYYCHEIRRKLFKDCTLVDCSAGCFCKRGYFRDILSGECMKSTQCPPCSPTEIYLPCDSGYEVSCGRSLSGKSNTIRCDQSGMSCFCQPGYVRNMRSGLCGNFADCPATDKSPTRTFKDDEDF